MQDVRRDVVKCRDYGNTVRHELGGLLRCRTLPDAKRASGAATNARGQRHSCIHDNVRGPERGLKVLQHFRVGFKRNCEDDDSRRFASGLIFSAGKIPASLFA